MSKKSKKVQVTKPIVRRMIFSVALALIFGLLCSYLAWTSDPVLKSSYNYWGGPLMLNIMFNRLLIGFLIVFAGFMTKHPLFGFRMYPALRGAVIGTIISIDMIFGPFIMGYDNASTVAWMTLFAGAFYGMVIDFVVTKYSAEGEDLFQGIK